MIKVGNKEFPTHGLLIDLDSLYDTRLAVLENIDRNLSIAALQDGYHERVQDVFPLVDKETFEKLYALRDTEVLEKALPTRMLEIVSDFIRTTVKQSFDTPFSVATEVYINTYPYQMTKEDASVFLQPMFDLGAGRIDVHVVNWALEDIEPAWVAQQISLMILYRYDEWLEIHSKNDNLRRTQLPDVTLLGPRLYFGRLPNQEEQAEFNKIRKDAFYGVTTQASGIIALDLIPVGAYSAEVPVELMAQILAAKPKAKV